VLALSALFPSAAVAQGHPAPSAEVMRQLSRRHHRGDWWRITTDSVRYEAQLSTIDAEGLGGVIPERKSPPAPDRIPWSAIARIDQEHSHQTRGQITWAILGMSAGFIPLANGHANSSQPKWYLLGGSALGFFVGGRIGAQNVQERALYVAPIPPPASAPSVVASDAARSDTSSLAAASPESAAGDSSAAPASNLDKASPPAAPPAAASAEVAARSGRPSPEIERACRSISTQSLLRIGGSFGTFHGYASTIGPGGLGGLRAETHYPSVQSPGTLSWDRINRLEVRTSNAGRGAMSGAMAVGLATGLIGIPIGALVSDNSDASMAGVVLACAGVGAGVGLVFGSAIGASSSSWHQVYPRR
jgi:hypothetical protein